MAIAIAHIGSSEDKDYYGQHHSARRLKSRRVHAVKKGRGR